LVGSIDQGTSSTRFMTFTPGGKVAAWAQMEHRQIFPEGEDKVSRCPGKMRHPLGPA
jgi:glycerol kinase